MTTAKPGKRETVRYRAVQPNHTEQAGQQPDGDWRSVRQQSVLDADDAGITAIDLVCTGFLAE